MSLIFRIPLPSIMERLELIRLLQAEIRRHSFDVFVDEPPVMAEGTLGAAIPGCPVCRKRIDGVAQLVDHIADDVVPATVEKLFPDGSATDLTKPRFGGP